uniref:Uncharacterized protein n=1 Tax=Meleagris gallopavo TaxID=9103 RepID=A0A803XNW7_MELGA
MQDVLWCFSQVKGTIDVGVTEGQSVLLNHFGTFLSASVQPTCALQTHGQLGRN